MSLFREHYIGGLVAYSAFFVVSVAASLAGYFLMQLPIDWNPTVPLDMSDGFNGNNLWKIGGCFVIAVLSGIMARRGHQKQEPTDLLPDFYRPQPRPNFASRLPRISSSRSICHASPNR